jgi:hypothetical protein
MDEGRAMSQTYRVFRRTARNWSEFASARKRVVRRGLSITEARRMCEEWNKDRSPSQVRRGEKMEFESE